MGYLTTQLLGGYLAERYGGKWVMGPAVFLSSILNFLLPTFAEMSLHSLLAVRILQGALQGPSFPSMFSMSSKWLPTPERNRMMTFIMAGKGSFINYRCDYHS
jgi:MFS family permease